MASARSVIELAIIGSTRGLGAAAAEARAIAERIREAEDRVSAARLAQENANLRVAESEARLNQARAGHEAALSRIGVAETNLQRAQNASVGTMTRLSQAQRDLDAVRSRAGATAEEIAAAEERVTRVRQEADLNAQRLQAAEARLASARGNAERSMERIRAAEEAVARARNNQFRASEALAEAEGRLATTRRRGTDDINRQRDGILGIFDALGLLAQAFTGADGASTSLLSKMGALNNVFTSIGGPIVQAVVGILQFVAILGAAGEIIGVIGGLIGQVFAGVPALLLGVAAAAGTVFIGLEGIKKAAEVITPAFDKLKAAVSGTFQRELTPVFRDLAGLLPKLTSGFQDIAVALSGLGRELVSTFTSARGVELLNTTLAGTANLIRGLGPGVTSFFSGLTQAAAAAAPAMTSLGAAIGGIAGRIGEVFTKLAADGTIQAAVTGLAATLQGLSDVIGPVIELLIRMGAALGGTLGAALSDLGKTIESMIPFFVHLAQVAGDLLVAAFDQLGPAIRDVIVQLLPGANQGLDGFANVIKNVVLPAIADFIRNIPNMIAAIKAFFLAATANALSFASSFLAVLSSILDVMHGVFAAMALIPGPMQESFARAAAVTDAFRGKVDETKKTVDGLHDKTVKLQLEAQGTEIVKGMKVTIDGLRDKIVKVTSNVFGQPDVLGLHSAIDTITDKVQTTISNVPGGPTQGTLGNQVLEGAIGAVLNKSVTTTANVPGTPVLGTQGNQALSGAIGNVNSKTVQVTANVAGTGAVQALVNTIRNVVSKTVNIVANVIGNPFGLRAKGGPVVAGSTYLVGEKGPELLTLGSTNGFVTDATRTRQMLRGPRGKQSTAQQSSMSMAAPEQPITVNVMLSQEQISELARVEIARQNRATKRTVLAGSGVTF
jgi:hypothetical protein